MFTVRESRFGSTDYVVATLPDTLPYAEVSFEIEQDINGSPDLLLLSQESSYVGGFFNDFGFDPSNFIAYGTHEFTPEPDSHIFESHEGRVGGDTTDPLSIDPEHPEEYDYEFYVSFDTSEFRTNDRGDLLVVASTTASISVFLVGNYSLDFPLPDGFVDNINAEDEPALVEQDVSTFSVSNSHVAFVRDDDVFRVDIRNPDGAALGTAEGLAPDVSVGSKGQNTAGGESIDGFGDWTRVDDQGRVVAAAFLDAFASVGLLRSTPEDSPVGPMQVLVKSGQATPGNDGTFDLPFPDDLNEDVHINGPGQVLFEVDVAGSSRDRGLFITDGIETMQVLRKGDPLDGRTISSFSLKSGDDPGGKQAFNDYAQAAFKVSFTDGTEGVYLYTPELSFRGTAGDGQWDSPSNWTLSIDPGPVHEVAIDGTAAVSGPTSNTTVKSMALGNSGAGVGDPGPSLTLQTGKSLGLGDGALTMYPDATLGFQIGSASSFARLIDIGDATLAGTLSVALTSGYVPQVGDVFDLIEFAGPVTGSFDGFDLPTLGGGLLWNTTGLSTTGELAVIALIPGDANGDGQVTGADLSILDNNFGQPGDRSAGDFNGDGQVTGADLSILDANFGAGGASSVAIPEPASITLIGLGGLILLRRRRSV